MGFFYVLKILVAKPSPSNHHQLPIQCHSQIFVRSADPYITMYLLVTIIKKEPILQRMPVFETRFNKVHIYK